MAILCTILNHQFINTIQDEKLLVHSITTFFEKIPIIKGRKYVAKLPEDLKIMISECSRRKSTFGKSKNVFKIWTFKFNLGVLF